MKYKTSIYKRCSNCSIIQRNKYRYIYCKYNKKHKQKQK